MGVYLSVFLEYRTRNKEGKPSEWKLLELYGPRKRLTESKYNENEKKWEEIPVAPDMTSTDGREFDNNIDWCYQGTVRDFFSSNSFLHGEYSDRGLPNDLSEGMKEYFAKRNKEIEDDKAKGDIWSSKWWWGETWCTVSELSKSVDHMIDKWKADIDKRISEREACRHADGTNDKLDQILALINKTEPAKETKKETDEYGEEISVQTSQDYIDELMDNDFWDVMNMRAFNIRLYETFSDYVDVYNEDDMRIVVYFS